MARKTWMRPVGISPWAMASVSCWGTRLCVTRSSWEMFHDAGFVLLQHRLDRFFGVLDALRLQPGASGP